MAWENFIISDTQGILSASQLALVPENPSVGSIGSTVRNGTESGATNEFNSRISGGSEVVDGTNYIDNSNYRLTGVRTSDGNYMTIGVNAYGGSTRYTFSGHSRYVQNNYQWYHGKFFFLIDESRQLGLIGFVETDGSPNAGWWYTSTYLLIDNPQFPTLNDLYSWIYQMLKGSVPIVYQWQSVPSISGKNGILSLSMIKDELLGDLTGGTWQSVDEVMDVLSPNSRLYKYWNNLAVGQEVTICYSGQINYLNIKRDTASSCQLKFYRDSSHFLIYSTSVNMQTLGRDPYLCFVIEEEQNLVQPIIAYVLDVQGQQQLTWSKISPAISDSEMYALYVWLQFTEDTTPNPYSQGSESNGGEDFNLTPQDDFSDELPPDITGLDCGFFTVYCPTSSQLQDLSSFLWSDDIIDNIKKYFGNVSDSIISLYMLPYKPSGLSSKKFQVGNIVLDDGPSVEYLTGQRYVDIDMGSFSIDPTFNSYLDYEPFTKLSIYLPFIGVQQLPTDEFMTKADPSGALSDQSGSTITVQYRIDLLTGGCVAYIKQGTQNKLQFSGKCGATLPISGANYNNMISGLVQAVGGLASTIASGGLTAPMSFGAAISGTVSAMKPDLYKAGNLSGELSLLSYNRPMIIKTRPNIHKDMADQINVDGLPSYKVKTIGDYTGYVSCVAVHVDGINCTDAEKEKIHSLLLEGVIV